MADQKREDDPLAGAQYASKEPRSKVQRLIDRIVDADYYGTMQSLGPTGYGIGGLTGLGEKATKAAKAAKAGEKAKYAKGGSVKTASRRGDGIAQRGKTKGRII